MSYFSELTRQYIDGAWTAGAGSWDIVDFDPYTGDKLAAITAATVEQIDAAYRAAERAQPAWAAGGGPARTAVLEKVVRLVDEREPEIVDALVTESGSTRRKAAQELEATRDFLREAVALALRPTVRVHAAGADGRENRVHREPVGVVAVISPFNFPFLVSVKIAASALALGNAVVLKPHQNTPVVGGTLVAALFEEAGLPPGLLNVVITDIAEIGDALLEHPVPRVVSFTGSDRTGRHVAGVAAFHLKRTVLEMGGNSALIVLDDADVDHAVDSAVHSRFLHQGQVCMAANRILLQRGVEREFTEKFTARVRALRTGDPRDPATHLGPLINPSRARSVDAAVERTLGEGATALVRGRVDGCLVEPTVLTGLPPDSPLLRQEIFGPVVMLLPFDDLDEGVRLANDTPYGLAGAVHTADPERGVEIALRVEAGMLHVNGSTIADDPAVPFGGEKNSGMGRLNGDAMVEAFTTSRWISVPHRRGTFPF